ncbi:histone H2A [Echinococcus multilocularis]|uniref:Histone H2A n=1 Tax=Echinococcus multilocularis TaxID=6211 RepID=A0A068Y9Q3_ECHMU|nr:histone H2A [Echinococcus multilocularis]
MIPFGNLSGFGFVQFGDCILGLSFKGLPAVVKLALDGYCNTNRVANIAFFQNAHTLRDTPGNDDFAEMEVDTLWWKQRSFQMLNKPPTQRATSGKQEPKTSQVDGGHSSPELPESHVTSADTEQKHSSTRPGRLVTDALHSMGWVSGWRLFNQSLALTPPTAGNQWRVTRETHKSDKWEGTESEQMRQWTQNRNRQQKKWIPRDRLHEACAADRFTHASTGKDSITIRRDMIDAQRLLVFIAILRVVRLPTSQFTCSTSLLLRFILAICGLLFFTTFPFYDPSTSKGQSIGNSYNSYKLGACGPNDASQTPTLTKSLAGCMRQQEDGIIPRHGQLPIRTDEELNKKLDGVTIAHGGVLSNIRAVLLLKKTKKMVFSKEQTGLPPD